MSKPNRKHNSNKDKITKVRLVTKSFEKVAVDEPPYFVCSRCHKIISSGYHYKESSIGDIVLCDHCNGLCKRDFKYKDARDIDDIDKNYIDTKIFIDFNNLDVDAVFVQIKEQYDWLISTINLAYAPKRITYMLDKFDANMSEFVRFSNTHAQALGRFETFVTKLISDVEKKLEKYKKTTTTTRIVGKRNRLVAQSDPNLRINSAYKLLTVLRTHYDGLVPDQVIDKLIVLWDSIVFYNNSVKITGNNQTLHCSLKGARSFYNHFVSMFSSLIPEIQIELHSRRAPQVLNMSEFHEVFTYLDIKEQITNGDIEAYRRMFEHVRSSKLSLNKIILPQDKTIYINYLSQVHDNNFKFIPVYERSLNDCDAFLFTVTRGGICYIIWENVSPNTATYIFRCTQENYEGTVQKIYDYVSSDIAYKRMMLYRKDLKIDIEYYMVLHSSFTQWKTDMRTHMRI